MWIVALIVGVLFFLLTIPLRLIIRASEGSVGLTFVCLGFRVPLSPRRKVRRPASAPTPTTEVKGRKKRSRTSSEIVDFIMECRETLGDTLEALPSLVRGLWRSWHMESADVTLTIGTGDPGSTGLLLGGLYATAGILESRWPQFRFRCQADYYVPTLEWRIVVVGRIRLIEPLWHLGSAVARFPILRLWRLRRQWAWGK